MATTTQASVLIANAKAYATEMVTAAETAMTDAIGAVEWARSPSIGYSYANLPDQPEKTTVLKIPVLADVALDLPTEPTGLLVFQDIPSAEVGVIPTFSGSVPTLDAINKPSDLAQFQEKLTPLALDGLHWPDAPEIIKPEPEPTLFGDYTAPDKPVVDLAPFDGTKPDAPADMTTDLADVMRSSYHAAAPEFMAVANSYVDAELLKINPQYQAQLAAIETQLTKYLAGGTGLNAAVEDAIYTRARSKNDAEARRVRDQSLADAAARGFTMPGGALLSATQQARQAGSDNNSAAAREIVVMQAEMEQKNLQFAVTTSTHLRTAAINAAMAYMQNIVSINGQAMEYAKAVVNAMVETYNAAVRVYTAKLDGYKTDAQVYQTLLQASLTAVEVYKAEIQAMQAMAQVDMTRVQVYKARVDVLTALSNMYRSQVEATVSKASFEKLKIDVFQAQVQAYGAQVSAKNAEWQGYVAQVGAQESKVRAYGAQAQAYASQMTGYKTQIEAKTATVQAAAITNDARAKQFVANVDAYKTVVSARGEVARTKLENQRQQVIAFQAESQAAVANAQVGVEYYKATSQIGVENAKLFLQGMVADTEAKTRYLTLLATLHQANATVHANLAGSAMAGMNALAVESATMG
jgi:hypothetical protein